MAQVLKRVRLFNPAKKKRKLSPLQKLFFGSKRQRAAVANSGKARKVKAGRRTPKRRKRRLRNVGEILTISLPGLNPGTRKRRKTKATMPKRRRRTYKRVANSSRRRTRRNYGTKTGRAWSQYGNSRRLYRGHIASASEVREAKGTRKRRKNPGTKRRRNYTMARRRRYTRRRRTVMSNPMRRRRRYNPSRRRRVVHHRRHRRSNPGFMSGGGTVMKIAGVIGGAALTKIISDRIPVSGFMSYVTTGIVATLQGKLVGKITKNAALGNNMMTGGFLYLALKVLGDYVPSLRLPFGLNGMGMLGPSSFYTPQVPMNGSMGSFQLPPIVARAIASVPVQTGMHGLAQRRTGRMR